MSSMNDKEKNLSSLLEMKRKAFHTRLARVYHRDEFVKNIKVFKREIARLKTALNQID